MPGIYIHIPFCKSKCTYCDFASFPGEIYKAEAYFGCLYKEIRGRSEQLKDYVFDTVYFGGGTPSFVEPKYIYGAMKLIGEVFNLKKNAEITLEVNPGTINSFKLEKYKQAKINRFSVGLQSANDNTLREINRIHNAYEYEEAIKLLHGYNISTDVMIGLPNEGIEDIRRSIDLATKYPDVKHISVYALKPEEGTPMYSRYLNGELPSEDEVADYYDFVVSYLKEKGFNRYEVSNFSKPGFESKHNLNYWRRGEYIGFGIGASSHIKNRRFTNTENIDEYIKCVLMNRVPEIFSEDVSIEDQKGEFAMLSLRTSEGAIFERYKEQFNCDFLSDFKGAIEETRKFLDIDEKRVKIKDEYLFVQNSILVYFINNF